MALYTNIYYTLQLLQLPLRRHAAFTSLVSGCQSELLPMQYIAIQQYNTMPYNTILRTIQDTTMQNNMLFLYRYTRIPNLPLDRPCVSHSFFVALFCCPLFITHSANKNKHVSALRQGFILYCPLVKETFSCRTKRRRPGFYSPLSPNEINAILAERKRLRGLFSTPPSPPPPDETNFLLRNETNAVCVQPGSCGRGGLPRAGGACTQRFARWVSW